MRERTRTRAPIRRIEDQSEPAGRVDAPEIKRGEIRGYHRRGQSAEAAAQAMQ